MGFNTDHDLQNCSKSPLSETNLVMVGEFIIFKMQDTKLCLTDLLETVICR
jgi:hypothetical protein